MTPNDINVITLDGKTHQVTNKGAITIAVQQGTVATIDYADAEGNLTPGEGRTSFLVVPVGGHRYSCGCGLSFDAADTALDGDARFDQGASVDCPGC
jgi:hypothetical protein